MVASALAELAHCANSRTEDASFGSDPGVLGDRVEAVDHRWTSIGLAGISIICCVEAALATGR